MGEERRHLNIVQVFWSGLTPPRGIHRVEIFVLDEKRLWQVELGDLFVKDLEDVYEFFDDIL